MRIKDGKYNTWWKIVGFDCENNIMAADGTLYDNGYGIMLTPHDLLFNDIWGSSTSGGYMNSQAKSNCTNVANSLVTILGSHLVTRNVLFSNSSGAAWTVASLTLPSLKQLCYSFTDHSSKYDIGEANYKLPLYNYNIYWDNLNIWTRRIDSANKISIITTNGLIGTESVTSNSPYYKPLIYIR